MENSTVIIVIKMAIIRKNSNFDKSIKQKWWEYGLEEARVRAETASGELHCLSSLFPF